MTRQIFFRDLRVFLFAFFAVKDLCDLHKKQVFLVFQIASSLSGLI